MNWWVWWVFRFLFRCVLWQCVLIQVLLIVFLLPVSCIHKLFHLIFSCRLNPWAFVCILRDVIYTFGSSVLAFFCCHLFLILASFPSFPAWVSFWLRSAVLEGEVCWNWCSSPVRTLPRNVGGSVGLTYPIRTLPALTVRVLLQQDSVLTLFFLLTRTQQTSLRLLQTHTQRSQTVFVGQHALIVEFLSLELRPTAWVVRLWLLY